MASESPLKITKNGFSLTSKALFVLKIFKVLPLLFGSVAKGLDWKDKVTFKSYDVTVSLTNDCNRSSSRPAASYVQR